MIGEKNFGHPTQRISLEIATSLENVFKDIIIIQIFHNNFFFFWGSQIAHAYSIFGLINDT